MKASIRDPAELRKIDPNQVAVYLEKKGWRQESYIDQKASIWTITDESKEEAEVLLPLNTSFRDYPYRVSEILQTLEAVEQRPQIDIYNNLLDFLSDIITIRLMHDNFGDGTVTLNDGYNLLHYAREMMFTTACSTAETKENYDEKNIQEANNYLDTARFRQTQKGSFILTIISPFKVSEIANHSEVPFERRVVKNLFNSLKLIQNFEKSNIAETVLANYSNISIDLCEALLGINKIGQNKGVDLSFIWSSAISAPEDISTSIFFSKKIMSTVSKIREFLESHVRNSLTINVTSLSSPPKLNFRSTVSKASEMG